MKGAIVRFISGLLRRDPLSPCRYTGNRIIQKPKLPLLFIFYDVLINFRVALHVSSKGFDKIPYLFTFILHIPSSIDIA